MPDLSDMIALLGQQPQQTEEQRLYAQGVTQLKRKYLDSIGVDNPGSLTMYNDTPTLQQQWRDHPELIGKTINPMDLLRQSVPPYSGVPEIQGYGIEQSPVQVNQPYRKI